MIKNFYDNKLKSVECTYEAQSTSISADDKVVYTVSSMAEGSGSLTVLGLTGEEKKLIFGGKATKGFALGVDDVQPQMALLFEQKKADGKKMLYCIFNVKFNPAGLSATSIEGGQIEEQTISLDFTSIANEDGYFYYVVDTGEEGMDSIAQTWYTAVPTVQ